MGWFDTFFQDKEVFSITPSDTFLCEKKGTIYLAETLGGLYPSTPSDTFCVKKRGKCCPFFCESYST